MSKHNNTLKRTSAFSKSLRLLPAKFNRKMLQVIEILTHDPSAKGLQMEKLKAPKDHVYSVRLSYKVRLIFRRLSGGTIELLYVGCHDSAYRPY